MLVTGCQGPFKRGTGGTCGCDCKCCPPPCCCNVAVFFDCGSPVSEVNPEGCVNTSLWGKLNLQKPQPKLPTFSSKPIMSKDRRFIFGAAATNCSVPCETICVPIKCGGNNMPCCCIEIVETPTGRKLLSVGNGYVTAPSIIPATNDCASLTVLINGMPPPVFVCDGDEIKITLVSDDECCCCTQIDIQCTPCPMGAGFYRPIQPLWKRKTDPRLGKTIINQKTGKPIIALNKMELIRRLASRKRAILKRSINLKTKVK